MHSAGLVRERAERAVRVCSRDWQLGPPRLTSLPRGPLPPAGRANRPHRPPGGRLDEGVAHRGRRSSPLPVRRRGGQQLGAAAATPLSRRRREADGGWAVRRPSAPPPPPLPHGLPRVLLLLALQVPRRFARGGRGGVVGSRQPHGQTPPLDRLVVYDGSDLVGRPRGVRGREADAAGLCAGGSCRARRRVARDAGRRAVALGEAAAAAAAAAARAERL
mmetsp:Transcript_48544/g.156918  ORF Transcript_48544/g.156918 Transcript_48544/m.156918 type:complete len:219 (-) Transcript_48544:989-1645(-)